MYSPPLSNLSLNPVKLLGWTTVLGKRCLFANESPLEAMKYTVAYLEKSSIKILHICFHAMIPEKVLKRHCGLVQIFVLA